MAAIQCSISGGGDSNLRWLSLRLSGATGWAARLVRDDGMSLVDSIFIEPDE
jgi:hypothetical protein